MALLQRPTHLATMVERDIVTHAAARRGLAVLRLGFGLTFLWAFLDKLLALGFATGVNGETGAVDRFGPDAWIHGGSPTTGFLKSVDPGNWFHGFFTGMAGSAWADWLFMIGLAGIGLALTLGIGMRIAAATGALLYAFMWAASFPLANNPVIDDHVIGAVTVIALALVLAGDEWGFGQRWARTSLVRRYGWLR